MATVQPVKAGPVTWEQASARRAERQFLGAPAPAGTPVAEVASTMLGAHAQVLSAAELSVGLRTEGTTRAEVRAALWEDRTLVKTYGPRGTVHLLPTAELPFWTAALTAIPSGASPFAPDVRLTDEQAEEVVAAIGAALDGTTLTLDELSEEIVARTGPWAGDLVMPAFQDLWPRWRQVMHRAGQSGALCFAPDRARRATYTRPPHFEPLASAEEGLTTLVRHYLRAYGPACPRHFAKWAAAPGAWSDRLFASLASSGEIERVDFEGEPAWVAAGDTDFPEDPARVLRGVRLLPYFDAYGIAAQPRERLFPGAAYDRALARGQAGNHPLLLVDGVVAGVWHQRRRGRRTTVTVEPLGRLTARQERELAERVERVGEVLQARAELAIGKVTVGPHA
ncbi:winged helix DNA-binding domain-containing protein [Streptomyces europaeiscabiei]|uniref:winged helix DNA-binding domain-containing protein n=1 Tax=Streptomyces europaeiscabiei TaxID=146819 RepID=UPI0029BF1808|nr:winged helix DNA-binding domain-containing protein [Streptomyces europaeiscabiei]MDX2769518.1 winged helix DNA-binding domain-containing protein [Streptomyces europaeiscabiei]MDX3777167.1 winged helix DNA-binding domain-containing protein [Streptomyces europaeiscabiei]MDX3834401.1 winged helix DNA-binding domain-containing protein [Streptomyces europaeiscabiei]